MPAISPDDLVLWRTAPYGFLGYLYIDNPPVIFRAQVDLASGATYPVQDVPFKNVTVGSHSVLKPNMTVIFESSVGADDLGRQRIRRVDGSTSQVRIGRSSQGTEDGSVVALNNAYITVLDDRRVAPRIPYIDPDTLETFKDADFDFATWGVNQGAVVNLGGGPIWIRFLKPADSTAGLSINSATNSYGIDGNIVSYANDIADGTYTSGGATTAAWTATFPPGRRYIAVSATDSNGVVTTRELLVVVLKTGSGYEPIKYFKILGHNPKIAGGNSVQFKIYQTLTGQAAGGVLVCYFEREFYGKTEKTLNDPYSFNNIKFVGWHQSDQNAVVGTQKGKTKDTTLTCLDINAKLDTLPGFSQEIGRQTSPTNWQEAKTANMDKFIVLNKRWLDTAMAFTDFKGANQGDMYAFSALGCGEKTRYQQDENLVDSAIAYHNTCTMQGRMLLTPDPQIRGEDPITIIALQEGDYSAIRYNGTRPPNYYWEQGGCVITSTANADNYVPQVSLAIAPGFSPGWGKNKNSLNQQLGLSIDEIKGRTKRRYIRNNARYGYIELDLTHPGDFGYDPAYQQWIEFTISDESAAWLGVMWTTQKCLLMQTKISYPFANGRKTKKVTVVLEIRVDDTNAGVEEQVQPTDPNPPVAQPIITIPVDPTGAVNANTAVALDGNTPPLFKTTANRGASWVGVGYSGFSDHGFYDYAFDPASPYLATGSGALNIYGVGPSGLWYGANILSAGVYTLTISQPCNDGAIRPDTAISGGGVVSFYMPAGVATSAKIVRFTSNGTSITWSKTLDRSGGSAIVGYLAGTVFFDIAQNGVDRVILDAWITVGGGDTISVWQIVNGGTPTKLNSGLGSSVLHSGYLQIPIKTPAGVVNSNSSFFIWTNNGLLLKTLNSGGSVTNITPPYVTSDFSAANVFVPVDNANVVLVASPSGFSGRSAVSYSVNGGGSYIQSAEHSGLAFQTNILKVSSFYSVYVLGQNYLGVISTRDLSTWEEWGNGWGGGNGGGWQYFIPLGI